MNDDAILHTIWWQVGTFAAGTLLTALLLAVGHWFPWPGRRLSRIRAYVYGISAILAGFAAWRILNADPVTVAGLAVICAAGGLVVTGAYKVDDVVLAIRKAHKAAAADEELD